MTTVQRPAPRGDDVIAARPTVSSVVVDGETVIYDEAGNTLHILDPTGSVVWACLDGAGTLAEVEVDLADIYGVPVAQVRTDVRKLIRRLDKLDLLDGVGGGPPVAPPKARKRRRAPSKPRLLKEPPNL
jgi:coenzyme PQQ synthesis protein D (PqqD)